MCEKMGFSFDPSLCFVCRLCKQTFAGVDSLKQHKLENHLGDCLGIKCIVFEERFLDHEWTPEDRVNSTQIPDSILASTKDTEDRSPPVSESGSQVNRVSTSVKCGKTRRRKRFLNPCVSLAKLSEQKLRSYYSKIRSERKNRHGSSPLQSGISGKTSENTLLDEASASIQRIQECTEIRPDIGISITKINQLNQLNYLKESPSVSIVNSNIYSTSPNFNHHQLTCNNETSSSVINESQSAAHIMEVSVIDTDEKLPVKIEFVDFDLLQDLTSASEGQESTVHQQSAFLQQSVNRSLSSSFQHSLIELNEPLLQFDSDQNIVHQQQQQQHQPQPQVPSTSSPSSFVSRVSNPDNQYQNKQNQQNQSARSFMCEICYSFFPTRNQLYAHSKSHSTDRPYNCPHCPATYKYRYALRDHLIVHGRSTPHTCRFCGRPFRNKKTLDDHVRTHTGDRPFKCEVISCNHAFPSRPALITHTRLKHSEELGLQQFFCPFCGKTFGFQNRLDFHIRIHHSSDKPFRCSHPGCGKAFKVKTYLVRHQRNHM